MDQFTKNKLKEWGLQCLITNFSKHRIDEECFTQLDREGIKEIIPALGDRIKFTVKYETFIAPLKIDRDYGKDQKIESSAPKKRRISGDDPEIIIEDPLALNDCKEDAGLSLNGSLCSQVNLSTRVEVIPDIIPFNFNGNGKNWILEVLENNFHGKYIVLQEYRKSGKLNTTILSDLVIGRELYEEKKRSDEFKIAPERLLRLAELTIEIFPTEPLSLFYSPRSGAAAAKGVYLHKYRTYCKILVESGARFINKRKSSTNSFFFTPKSVKLEEELKTLRVSEENAIDLWKNSYEIRKKYGAREIFEYFKILSEPSGYLLFRIDFEQKYPAAANNFKLFWPAKIAKKMLAYMEKKKRKELDMVLNEYGSDIIDEKDEALLALMVLALGVGPKTKYKSTTTNMDVLNSFIIRLNNFSKYENFKESLKKNKDVRDIQPVAVIVGDLRKMSKVYVLVNNIEYMVDGILDAIDICIKIVLLLKLKFPTASDHIWYFLVNYVYKLPVESNLMPLTMVRFMSAFDKFELFK